MRTKIPHWKRLRSIFDHMHARCYDKREPGYKDYGGRGITVCAEWSKPQFKEFTKWALSHGYATNLSIDRKDNNGNYSPDNCKWSTQSQQARNSRSNVSVSASGETKLIVVWLVDKRCIVDRPTLPGRMRRKWPSEEALTAPPGTIMHAHEKSDYVTAFGETKATFQWRDDPRCVVSYITLRMRLQRGWEPEKAITIPAGSYVRR